MTFEQIAFPFLGIFSTLLGLGLIYLAWKSRVQLQDTFTFVGWLLLVFTTAIWITLSGWEFGLIYGLTIPSLLALVIVAFNLESRRTANSNLSRVSIGLPTTRSVLKATSDFLLAVPFALVASVIVSYSLGVFLVEIEVNQMVLAICLLPFIWGVFAWWLLADISRLRPMFSLLGITVLCFIPLFGVAQ